MDLLDVLLAFAAAPLWLGVALLAGGILAFGVWIGAQIPRGADECACDDEDDDLLVAL